MVDVCRIILDSLKQHCLPYTVFDYMSDILSLYLSLWRNLNLALPEFGDNLLPLYQGQGASRYLPANKISFHHQQTI